MDVVCSGCGYHINEVKKNVGIIDRIFDPQVLLKQGIDFTLDSAYIFGVFDHELMWAGRNPNSRKVFHWVGSDLVRAYQEERKIPDGVHILCGEWQLGIAKRMNLPVDYIFPISSCKDVQMTRVNSDRITHGCYVGRFNGPYIWQMIVDHALQNPNEDHLLFGAGSHKLENYSLINRLPNVEVLGHVCNIQEVIDRCHTLIRYVMWDGFSQTVMEFGKAGRGVCSNIPYPFSSPTPSRLDFPLDVISKHYFKEYGLRKTKAMLKLIKEVLDE